MKCVCLLHFSFALYCNLIFFFVFFFPDMDWWLNKKLFWFISLYVLQYPFWSTAHHPEHKGDATAGHSVAPRSVKHRRHRTYSQAPQTTQKQSSTIAGRRGGGRAGWDWEKGGVSNAAVCNAVRHAGRLTDTGNNLRDVRDQQSSSGEHDFVLSEMPFGADVLKAFLRV